MWQHRPSDVAGALMLECQLDTIYQLDRLFDSSSVVVVELTINFIKNDQFTSTYYSSIQSVSKTVLTMATTA